MTTTNKSRPTIATFAAEERGWELIDELDTVIAEMDTAFRDANYARKFLLRAEVERDIIEARVLLSVTGGNADSRKATVLLQLSENPQYQNLTVQINDAHDHLRDADQRVMVLKERARLLRSALQLEISSTQR